LVEAEIMKLKSKAKDLPEPANDKSLIRFIPRRSGSKPLCQSPFKTGRRESGGR
jgi:hypothetical protein